MPDSPATATHNFGHVFPHATEDAGLAQDLIVRVRVAVEHAIETRNPRAGVVGTKRRLLVVKVEVHDQ